MLLLSTIIGAVAGALTLSFLVTLAHQLVIPEALADGQYFLVWFFCTLPIGAVLGALSGAAICSLLRLRLKTGAKICLFGGGIMSAFTGLRTLQTFLIWIGDGSVEKKWWYFRLCLPIYGLPLLWALFLLRKGRRLLK